jgi:hypothetical protein
VNLLGVGLVYAGLLTALAGAISLLKPLAFAGIQTRGQGLAVLACSLVLVAAGGLLPARTRRASGAPATATRLDEFVPAWQFGELHRVAVHAPRQQVYQAIKAVTADEILFFRALTWIRRFGRPGPENILNAPGSKPLLEVATRTSFLLLAEDAQREIVLGTLVIHPPSWRPAGAPTPAAWKALSAPGFAKAAINFRVDDAGRRACAVTTETRVFATDPATRQRFAAYWRVIYPGSSLIRAMWLRAIRRRAEEPAMQEVGASPPLH